MQVKEAMHEGVEWMAPSASLIEIAQKMKEDDIGDKKIRRLPVIDKNNCMVGMLSLDDVSHAASHELTGELAASVSAYHAS